MPDTGFLFLSLGSVLLGGMLFLFPGAIGKMSSLLNRTMAVLDDRLLRYRYFFGLLAFGASYAFFKLAVMLPSLH